MFFKLRKNGFLLSLTIILIMSLLSGCNTSQSEDIGSDTTDFNNSSMESIETENVTEKNDIIEEEQGIDEETFYYEYIKEKLIPEQGFASTEPFTIMMDPPINLDGIPDYGMYNENYGIVSIDIDDYNGDNQKEMLVLSLQEEYDEHFICEMVLSLYGVKDGEVSLYDSQNVDKHYMEIGIEHYNNFMTLEKCKSGFLLTKNYCLFNGESMNSFINIISLKNNKIEFNTFIYHSNMEDQKLYYNGEVVHELYNSMLEVEKLYEFADDSKVIIEEKLSDNGFTFDSVEYEGYGDENKFKEFKIKSDNKIIAQYTAEYYYPDYSVITPHDNSKFREMLSNDNNKNNFEASGTCGKNVSWELDKNGTLRIYGEGDMDYFSNAKQEPWYSFIDDIKTIAVNEGVTSIGECAFIGCINLKSADISDTVTAIGEYAFNGCENMESIKILNKNIHISNRAFGGCSSLSDVYFSGTESDWDNAFASKETNFELTNSSVHFNFKIT